MRAKMREGLFQPTSYKTGRSRAAALGAVLGMSMMFFLGTETKGAGGAGAEIINLPPPRLAGPVSVEASIAGRRTVRSFSPEPLTLDQMSQLCWAAQGITEKGGFKRAVPSAGALYPLEIYIAFGDRGVKDLAEGIYRYLPPGHRLERIGENDVRNRLGKACLGQMWLAEAPVVFIVAAEYERCMVKYGQRGIRYTDIEAGACAENLFIQAEALKLHAGIIGAFEDDTVATVAGLLSRHRPLLVMPIGN